tara:strand:+ start:821 stop:1093 length:273 start_codon:yes stop_codon:yes gene_type:complete
MSNKTEKIYVGNGVEKFDGDMVSVSVNLTKLKTEGAEHIFDYNGQKFIKLNINKNRDGANEYGKTHYVSVDTYKPEPKKVVAQVEDDLPF